MAAPLPTTRVVARSLSFARDLAALTKPRVTRMVLLTALGGAWLAPGALDWALAAIALLGIGAVVAAANTFNCWLEEDADRRMRRTSTRPLAAGRLVPEVALWFGIALLFAGVSLLVVGVNVLTALAAAAALVLYVGVYTPLKQRTPAALLVGAVPGAAPPLLGWISVTGRFDVEALVLFGILFLWQLPHFIAISDVRRDEYARAGFRVLSTERGERVARTHAVFWAAVLLPLSLLPTWLGLTGTLYLLAAAGLGLSYLVVAILGLGLRRAGDRWARRLFVTSLVYLPLLFAALALDATG